MVELLEEVFIKEQHESGIDRVFIVKNLPKHLIYRKVPKMVQRYDRDGYTDGTLTVDPSGETIDGLKEGLEASQSGDGSILFLMGRAPGKAAMEAVDAYITGTLPRDVVVPKRVNYPMDPTDSRSMPKPKSLIPVVELPKSKAELPPVSPEAQASPVEPAPIKKRQLTEQQREAARERLARAREVRKQQLINEHNAPKA